MRRLPGESLAELAARARAEKEAAAPIEWDEDLIPPAMPAERSPEQYEIDAVLGRVDIVEAYKLWCGKMEPNVGSKRESIMVSCPNPAHPDAHPSAWLNLDIGDGGVGNCASCELGFDKYDIAAWHFGFRVPDYKHTDFPEVRRRMAEGLGYRVMVVGKDEWLEKIQPDEQDPREDSPDPLHTTPVPDVPAAIVESPFELADDENVDFDWRDLPAIEPGTFMYEWMSSTSELYEPEEFYLWLGFVAMGLAVGNRVVLDDEPTVRANLLTCLVGSTGTGKSRAMRNLHRLVREAMPWDSTDAKGVRMIESSGSGEALIDQFTYFTSDPTDKTITTEHPITGLYIEDEFESVMARINKAGSTYRGSLMQFFDSDLPVSTNSRTHGSKVARQHFMELVSSTQPTRLSDLVSLGDASSGFLNRFQFVFGTSKKRPALSTIRLDLARPIDLLRNVRAWSGATRRVQFMDHNANAAWSEHFDARIVPLIEGESQLAARIELQCKKLLLLFAINDKMTTVATDHVASLERIFPYMLRCYGVVEREAGADSLERCTQAIREYFMSHPDDAITIRVLISSSGARKFKNTELTNRAVANLVTAGEIAVIPQDRARTTKYRLNRDEPIISLVR